MYVCFFFFPLVSHVIINLLFLYQLKCIEIKDGIILRSPFLCAVTPQAFVPVIHFMRIFPG